MHLSAPGQARVTHLGGRQAASRLSRDKGAEPRRMLISCYRLQLASMRLDHRVELGLRISARPALRLEQRALAATRTAAGGSLPHAARRAVPCCITASRTIAGRTVASCTPPGYGVPGGQQRPGQRDIMTTTDPDSSP